LEEPKKAREALQGQKKESDGRKGRVRNGSVRSGKLYRDRVSLGSRCDKKTSEEITVDWQKTRRIFGRRGRRIEGRSADKKKVTTRQEVNYGGFDCH